VREAKCKICGKTFFIVKRHSEQRTTCGPDCLKIARQQGGGQKAEEIEPDEFARRVRIVRHNSMVDSGHLRGERLVMDW
jgi:hypothetical protein